MFRNIIIFILAMIAGAYIYRTYIDVEKVDVIWYDPQIASELVSSDRNSGNKPKKILIFVYTDWCGWCKKMEKEFYGRSDIAKYINENYYPIRLNADNPNDIVFNGETYKYIRQNGGNYHQLVVALMGNRLGFPTNIILDDKFEMLKKLPGYIPHDNLFCITKFIGSDIYKSKSWEDFEKSCE
jgi:thioredoxin-related protein